MRSMQVLHDAVLWHHQTRQRNVTAAVYLRRLLNVAPLPFNCILKDLAIYVVLSTLPWTVDCHWTLLAAIPSNFWGQHYRHDWLESPINRQRHWTILLGHLPTTCNVAIEEKGDWTNVETNNLLRSYFTKRLPQHLWYHERHNHDRYSQKLLTLSCSLNVSQLPHFHLLS